GIPVIQHDVEKGLENYSNDSIDYVILSQTVQTLRDPEKVFKELLRVGKKVIVSFPNFAHWRCRAQLFFLGKSPVTPGLPYTWHNSPNKHFLSLKDFDEFCKSLAVKVENKIPLIKTSISPVNFAPNLFAEQAIYVTSKE
ncbi:MAG: methionine biosynthesis protein MetW, partial [Planctomycetota bacterium]